MKVEKLDGSCPKCGNKRLIGVPVPYNQKQRTIVTVDYFCYDCNAKVCESYSLVKSEVIEER